jgi:hypothetical protein
MVMAGKSNAAAVSGFKLEAPPDPEASHSSCHDCLNAHVDLQPPEVGNKQMRFNKGMGTVE